MFFSTGCVTYLAYNCDGITKTNMAKIKIDLEVLELVCDCAKYFPKLPRKKKKQCKKEVSRKLNELFKWYIENEQSNEYQER